MGSTTHSIEVNAPLKAVYNQWTQFEEFPHFMEGVEEVRQQGDKHLFWKAKIGGKEKAWEAEITDQVPDERIAWQALTGAPNSGEVTFEEIDSQRTRITLALDYEPEGFLEKAGDAIGIPSGRVEGDLKRFRDYIESKGESGGWRGHIGSNEPLAGSASLRGQTVEESSTGHAAYPDERAEYELERSTASDNPVAPGLHTSAARPSQAVTEEVPLTEEQLKVGKREVAAGEVAVRKVVETEHVNVPVELKREDAVIERIPASEVKAGARDAFQEGEIRVPLSHEEVVVGKETHVTGGVRVRKTENVEQQNVSDTVRREDVRVDKGNLAGRVRDDATGEEVREGETQSKLSASDKPTV